MLMCKPRVRTEEVLVGGSCSGGRGLGCLNGGKSSLKLEIGDDVNRVSELGSPGNLKELIRKT